MYRTEMKITFLKTVLLELSPDIKFNWGKLREDGEK